MSSTFDDHFRSPRNTGVLEDADGRVKVENPVCGDVLVLSWKAAPEAMIEAVRFQVIGCPAAIAAGSLLTEMIVGGDAKSLAAVGADEIAAALGGLGTSNFHAAVLAADALEALIKKLS